MKARPSPAAILRDGRGVYHRAAPCADPLAALFRMRTVLRCGSRGPWELQSRPCCSN